MIQNLYPLFEPQRVLKKEALCAVRDMGHDFAELEYAAYSDGIIRGCRVAQEEEMLVVFPGIVKHNGSLFFLPEQQEILFEPNERLMILKLRFLPEEVLADFRVKKAELVLEESGQTVKSGMELCRFRLSKGFRLRGSYTGLADIQTEFDTVNLADASWGAPGGAGLSPIITGMFAKEAMERIPENPWDISFCMRYVEAETALPRALVTAYLGVRLGKQVGENASNRELFEMLCTVLQNIKSGEPLQAATKKSRRYEIFVD